MNLINEIKQYFTIKDDHSKELKAYACYYMWNF